MCLPFLAPLGAAMGASASSAAAVGTMTAVSLVGTGMSAYGAYQNSKASQGMANYNAQVAENNARTQEIQAQDALRRGDQQANEVRRNADMLKGSQRASMAAKGLDLAEGTAAELQDQTDFFSLTDQATTRDNAKREAWAIRVGASNSSSEAAMQRAGGKSANPGFAAATTLIGGASQVAGRWYSKA